MSDATDREGARNRAGQGREASARTKLTGGAKLRERLIVFTRWPRPGEAKTRLIPALGAEGAAQLQRRMTARVIRMGRRLRRREGVQLEVRFEGGSRTLMQRRFGYGVRYRRQPEGDLGNRMRMCFRGAFREGCDRVVLVGSDCPGVTATIFQGAFERLHGRDLVLGPAQDGGYYLVGLRRRAPGLFDGPSWGSSTVLRQTLRKAGSLGLTHALLQTLQDVDTPEDLQAADFLRRSRREELLSVVVPALNEADQIADSVESARAGLRTEVIVADGGSTDGTADIARRAGAEVLRCEPGRARQMNMGARAGDGDTVLFLHADTRLPAGFEGCVRRLLNAGNCVAGAFRFNIGSFSPAARFIERTVNMRARRLQLPYGDQALFMRRRTFEGMGGFPDMPIMEDYECVRRLRARGRIAVARAPAYTSPRRWQQHGIWKTTLVNKCMVAGYRAGVSPDALAGWYRGGTGPSQERRARVRTPEQEGVFQT
ncbi:MAG: TIGR04283 family arsenosugar biosynthesis glycosyltransferase [Planctomycetota bacterium]